jgi:hypothetical protein
MKKILGIVLALCFSAGLVHAAETVGESAQAAGNNVARKVKRGGHRLQEAVCTEGDLKCAAEKGKHRVKDAGDSLHDKAKEAKSKVD